MIALKCFDGIFNITILLRCRRYSPFQESVRNDQIFYRSIYLYIMSHINSDRVNVQRIYTFEGFYER